MRGPPRSTRTDPLFPYPPLFRSLPRRGALPLLIPSSTGPIGPQSPSGDCGLLFGAWGAPAASFAGRGLRGALAFALAVLALARPRSEEHTSELQSLMRISYAVFCLKKKKNRTYPATDSSHT